ncbi:MULTISPECIES: type 4a pilus biogenesis protein PilO [unclassified Moraxella]|uniref:type 4a pilus biogenesis protein PilO n=1 Tax=unclassified Moraxella TaxID=2685852 RepID=UPI003AF59119
MVKLTKSNKKSLFAKKEKTVKPKKQFNFQEFADSFKSLDQNNYGSWPIPVKITVLLFMIGLIALLTWFLPISSKRDEIASAEAEEQTLLDQYRTKESKARHLKEYQQQVLKMQSDFKELLNQLPKETRISDLVDGINMVGVGSSITFKDIKVEPEVSQEFFIEQPIRIEADGDYHQFGAFLSGLAKLPRIITLHDFEVNNPQTGLDKLPETKLILNVKTYRSKELTEDDLKKGQKPAEKAGANDAKK